MVGSSKINRESFCSLPISLANFSLWASPPERLGVSSPKVRYPSPSSFNTVSRCFTSLRSSQASRAVWMSMSISSGRETLCPFLFVYLIRDASLEYLEPLHSGHGMSTSGRNCTSRLTWPVPSHTGQRSFPVL